MNTQALGAHLEQLRGERGLRIDTPAFELGSQRGIPAAIRDYLSLITELTAWLRGRDDDTSCNSKQSFKLPRDTAPSLAATDLLTERTPEIAASAAKLGNPERAFFYVRDEIRFLPRFGAAQSAAQVLRSGAGTAADKSSLLIALLRAQGVAAQYLAGEILVPEAQLKSLLGVAGPYDLYWALRLTLGSEPTLLYRGGKRVWRLPHVWVHAYLGGRWRQLDAAGELHDQKVGALVSSPIETELKPYLFTADASGNWVKSGTIVDELLTRAGDLSTIGLIDRGAVVTEREDSLPYGTIGVGDPCVRIQGDEIPETYRFHSLVRVGSAAAPSLRAVIGLAQARGGLLKLSHSAGVTDQGAVGPGQLVLSLAGAELARGSATLNIGESFDLYHAIREPEAYGGRIEERVTPALQAGGIQVLSHFLAPVGQADFNAQLLAIRGLAQAHAPETTVAPELLRYAAIFAHLRAGENDRDLGRLRGVSRWTESLIVTQSLGGQVLDDQDQDLGAVPAGASIDWVIAGPVYSRTGNHAQLADYPNIAQARGEAVVAGSAVESQIWEDLFGQAGVSAVRLLQLSALQNDAIARGVLNSAPIGLIQGSRLDSASVESILAQLGPGMRPHGDLLRQYSTEAPDLYAVTDTVTLPSGWNGVGMILAPSTPTGRAAAYISPQGGGQGLLHGGLMTDAEIADACLNLASFPPGQQDFFVYFTCRAFACFNYVCQGVFSSGSIYDIHYYDGHGGNEVVASYSYQTCPNGTQAWACPKPPGGGDPVPPTFPPAATLDSGALGATGNPALGPSPTQLACGKPVNLATGAMWHTFADFSLPGRTQATSISFERTYLALPSEAGGDFGPHWAHNWGSHLRSQGSSSAPDIVWIDETGGPWLFKRQSDGSFAAPQASFMQLTEAADHYELKRKDGALYVFSRGGDTTPAGTLVSLSEPHGQKVELAYDASGKLANLAETRIGTIAIARDGSGRIARITRARDGVSYDYTYDAAGNLRSSTDGDGHPTTYAYVSDRPGTRAQGLLAAFTDPLGRVTSFTYFDNGRAHEQTEPGGAYRAFQYAVTGYTRMLDLDGQAIEFKFDRQQRLIENVYPDGSHTRQTWDGAGNVTSRTDELGQTTRYAYDARGNATGIKKPLDAAFLTISYDAHFGKPTLIAPLTGSATELTIDPITGDVTAIRRADAQGPLSLGLAYDALGNVLGTNNGLATYAHQTDANGLYTRIFDARNPETRAYDPRGRLSARTWAATGRVMTYVWDNLDRLLRVDDTAGPAQLRTYDVVGRLLSEDITDGTTHQLTRYAWDDRDRLISTTDALGRVSRIEYDRDSVRCEVKDLPARLIDPAGRVTRLEYDSRQRLIRQTDALGGITRYNYNARGDLTELTDASGNSTFFAWDGNRRLMQRLRASLVSDPRTAKGTPVTEATNFEYDASGKLVREEKVSASDPHTVFATTLIYDELDRVVEKKLAKEVNGAIVELQDDSVFAYSRQLDATLQTKADNEVEKLGFTHELMPPYAITGYSVAAADAANSLGLTQDSYQLTSDASGQIASIASASGKLVWSAQYVQNFTRAGPPDFKC